MGVNQNSFHQRKWSYYSVKYLGMEKLGLWPKMNIWSGTSSIYLFSCIKIYYAFSLVPTQSGVSKPSMLRLAPTPKAFIFFLTLIKVTTAVSLPADQTILFKVDYRFAHSNLRKTTTQIKANTGQCR